MGKIVHISDIHIHDREANLSAVADGFASLVGRPSAGGKGGLLEKGVGVISAIKRMGYAIKEDRPDLRRILVDDILREEPDHIVISGDLTNTSLESECEEARRCFERFIPERRLSIVPGNHDYPVFTRGTAQLNDVLHDAFPHGKIAFPWVKLLGRELALIGLNSCLEMFDLVTHPEVVVHTARGKLHRNQLHDLERILSHPKLDGRSTIVVLHHHVLQAPKHAGKGRIVKAHDYFMERAVNSDYLLSLLAKKGVRMVLHGHRHVRKITAHGPILVVGAGSAIHPEPPYEPQPSYYVYTFDGGVPRITVKVLDGDRYRAMPDDRFMPDGRQMKLWQAARHDRDLHRR
jgi:3',5'-cyclic AMP phosphodiesterase CpdA